MFSAAILAISAAIATLPLGNNSLDWGASEKTLKKSYNVVRAGNGSGRGHGFTDFNEINPVVYIDKSSPDKKLEFYFHEGKLYKTYTIHLDQKNAETLYEEKLAERKQKLGKPSKQYIDQLFSLNVLHNVWDFEQEQYELRFGAGYVFEVRSFKPAAKEKRIEYEMQHAI